MPAAKKKVVATVGDDMMENSRVYIPPSSMMTMQVTLRGTSPYVQNKFSAKARIQMEENQRDPKAKKNKSKAQPKDFDSQWMEAIHVSSEGWYGIPANGLRAALVRACSLVPGLKMTQAKMCVFVLADGYDADDQTPLFRITKGEPGVHKGAVRLATGVIDVRWRPIWHPGWEAVAKIQFDNNTYYPQDVFNLLVRAGQQVGIGEGRAFSKESVGCGWGSFEVDSMTDFKGVM